MFKHILLTLAVCAMALAQTAPPAAAPATPAAPAAPVARPATTAATNPATTSVADDSEELTWPRVFVEGDLTLRVYQPQIEKWENNQLDARAAVSVTPAGEKAKPAFGAIWLKARTEIDKENRIVTLEEIQIPRVAFPQDKAREPEYLAMLNKHLPEERDVPLDHLQANLTATEAAKAQTIEVKNDPPKIIVSKTPALLILIDGEPALRQVEGQKLMRVVNTRALILLDQSASRYYLQAMGRWLSAALPTGPYTLATSIPAGIDQLKEQLAKTQTIDLLVPKDPAAAPKEMPTIYVSTTPAELIQSLGEPQYTPITGTQLLYCSNSDSALFMQVGTQQLYVLVSGRWFKAMTLQGPWTFVPGKDLPPDFAKIPPDGPKANVRVSVPGTPESKEAVIANAIPQTATVKISEAKLTVSYDGAPKFKKIEDTKGLSYAENTTLPVIRIDNDPPTFWCVQNGVWFSAPAPTGPWGVAVSIPGIIYTIPVGSPLHYVTYVKVYGSTSEVVYVGYTPGYMGTAVSTDGVVVYGTGYYYPAYVGTYWVGYPPTYGYGASFAAGTATGLAFGFAAGAWMGSCWTTPYWGACYGYRDIDINTSNVYNNWRGGVTTANRSYKYDPWTGKSESMGRGTSFNPYTGRASVGGYSNYINRESGNYDLKKAGATYNPNTGVVTGGGVRRSGNMYDGEMDVTSGKFQYDTDTNTGVGRKGDDFYAGQDGNVYKYNRDEGWSQRTDGGDWQSTDRPTGSGDRQQQLSAQQRQNLDSQRQSRQTSQQRYNTTRSSGTYQRTAPPPRSSGGGYRGGGGMRGGGGRGGRR